MVLLKWYNYLTLIAAALIPAVAAVILHYVLKKWKWFNKRNYWIQQLLIGIFFSWMCLSVFYFGVEYSSINYSLYKGVVGNFSSANAVPLISGLVFGGPSGFITGTIAAIYRLVIYGFNGADVLKPAECVTVFLSGSLGWLLRATLFDNKKPKWFYGFIIGLLIEVIHMLLIFTVCIAQVDATYAYGIIRVCDFHCFFTVALSIVVALAGISKLEKEKLVTNIKGGDKRIATKIQKWMALTFVVGIAFTFTFTFWGNWQKSNYDTQKSLEGSAIDLGDLVKTNDNILMPLIPAVGLEREEALLRDKDSGAYYLTCSHRIGLNGFAIVLDYDFQRILSVPSDLNPKLSSPDVVISEPFYINGEKQKKYIKTDYKEGKIYEVALKNTVDDTITRFYMRYVHVKVDRSVPPEKKETLLPPNFLIVSFLSKTEATVDMGLTIRLTEYIELLIFIAIFAIIYIFIKKVVVLNVYKINKSLDKITGGNLNVKVNVRSNQEFSDLSDDINQTVDTLKHFIEEANKRIDAELKYAKEIQQSSLPVIFPNTPQYELYATMHPAKQIGGDFYDFFPIDSDHMFILMADVSGKGIPAAMFMMRAKTLVKSLVTTNELSLDLIITGVNDELNRDNKTGMFVTAWFGILNIKTGDVEYVNAGHCPPLVGKKGKYKYLKMSNNTVLGVIPGVNYKLERIKLKVNESIILYTDGVTEATSKKKKLYGESRLLSVVNNSNVKNVNEMLKVINDAVDKFQHGAAQADDITILMVKYKQKK